MLLTLVGHAGTKEMAFVHAVTSAGVVHAVTVACSTGNLTDCTCDMNPGGHQGGPGTAGHVPGVPRALDDDGWRWGGCSDNVNYGVWFTMMFVDAGDRTKIGPQLPQQAVRRISRRMVSDEVKALVNLHNNEVGRKVSRTCFLRS